MSQAAGTISKTDYEVKKNVENIVGQYSVGGFMPMCSLVAIFTDSISKSGVCRLN